MTNVSSPLPPLIRFPTLLPGQYGVPGTGHTTGLRTDVGGVVFYVDPNAVGVSDGRDGTDPDEPLQTVAAALTKCRPYMNDVVAVMSNNSWQYGNPVDGRATGIAESVIVTVPGVRIVGVAPAGQGVYWSPAANLGTCITVRALDVTIEGFFFWSGDFGGADGILADWDGTTTWGDNLTVRHCTFDGSIDTAIQLEYVWFGEIAHCQFWQCDEYGIYADPAGSPPAYCLIHDNVFHDCVAGAMTISEAIDCHIYRNSIYNGNAQGAGVATDEGIDTSAGGQNQVFDNWFSCVLPAASNGDWDDLNSGAATDAWIANHCTNGMAVTTPT